MIQSKKYMLSAKRKDGKKLPLWKMLISPLSSLLNPQMSASQDSASSASTHALIDSAEKCTVYMFECVLIDENYAVLGNGTPEQLQQAWTKIYSAYITLMDKGQTETHIHHMAKIYALSAKIQIVKMLCEGIVTTGFERYFQALEAWGYKCDKIADVSKVIASIKADEFELQTLIRNMPKQDGGKITRDFFTNALCEMEAMQGFALDKETLSIAKFAIYFNKLVAKSEQVKKQKGKRQ